MTWRDTWRVSLELTPLGLTEKKADQGEFGLADFEAGTYPACSRHGAMNRVSMPGHGSLWRCLNLDCNIGCEWDEQWAQDRVRAAQVSEELRIKKLLGPESYAMYRDFMERAT